MDASFNDLRDRMIPRTMTAIAVQGDGRTPDSLVPVELPTPRPGPGEILIRVRAAGVNRPDILQRRGLYPPPPGASTTLGLEVSGDVAMAGDGAPRWREGDQVTALLGGGGYAEYAVVDARHALPIPDDLDLTEAAALPETVFTVWANVFELGGLKRNETLLVHGATSGIGVTATQMAKATGARVIATSRGAEKARAAREIGASLAIDASAEDFAAAVEAAGGADVVLDMVGGDYLARNLAVLKPGGRLVQIAFQGGHTAEIDLRPIMMKRLTVTGSTLRARPADEKARLARAVEESVWPWIANRWMRPAIDATFPLADAAAAHARLEQGTHVGKIVLLP
jgi:putative PIG3 family NAD(P)H quinone oxidoreductase